MFDIRVIKVTQLLDEGTAMLAAHREELSTHKHLMVLNPDRAAYEALEDSGKLLTLAAFDGDGKLVGYSASFIGFNLHYSDLLYAHNDVMYVAPEHRKSGLGGALIARTEHEVRERGARFMLWHAKPSTPLSDLMPRLGYDVQDIIYSKEL